MMDCLQAQTILSEAIDGAVDSDALSEARAHCEGCPECATFIRGSTCCPAQRYQEHRPPRR